MIAGEEIIYRLFHYRLSIWLRFCTRELVPCFSHSCVGSSFGERDKKTNKVEEGVMEAWKIDFQTDSDLDSEAEHEL